VTADSLTNPIDALMERASRELFETRYFDAAALCMEALLQARAKDDFARMARICLPLQEARRWIRQEALDSGVVRVIARGSDVPDPFSAGCYLVQPPMVGVDARQLRWRAWEAGAPVFVLCREPMNRDGLWPIVGVGERVVRVRIDPPINAERVTGEGRGPTGDRVEGPIDPAWFAQAGEVLGDRAIADAMAAGEAGDPPAWRVDDLLDLVEAAPEHEKLLQALASVCKEAVGTVTPTDRRRRRGLDDPRSF
jgi:hypothetical protein